mmetsp:Transcript_14763/g.60256  ORF Transcript_14763/g.60256 Transcript_14763/m.60256 type:complete len:219 (+) Transcript_14763:773-1429(+)
MRGGDLRLRPSGNLPRIAHAAAGGIDTFDTTVARTVHVHGIRIVGPSNDVIRPSRRRRPRRSFAGRVIAGADRQRLHRLHREPPLLRISRQRRRHEREHASNLARRGAPGSAARGEPLQPDARLPVRHDQIRLEQREQRPRDGERRRRRRRVERVDGWCAIRGLSDAIRRLVKRFILVEVGEIRPGHARHRDDARLGRARAVLGGDVGAVAGTVAGRG